MDNKGYFDETMSLQEQLSIRMALDRFRGEKKSDLTDYMLDMERINQETPRPDNSKREIRVTFFDSKDLNNSRKSIYEVTMLLEPTGILLEHGGVNNYRTINKVKNSSSIRMSLQEFAATQVAYGKFQSAYQGNLSGYLVSLSRNKAQSDEVFVFFHDSSAKGNGLGSYGSAGKSIMYGLSMSLLKDKIRINSASFQR